MFKEKLILTGHIIDSLTLPKTLDTIMEQGGDFKIEELNVGKLKTDKSSAIIEVTSDDEKVFNRILDEVTDYGAEILEDKEVQLIESAKDKTVPDNFYSTTNYNTKVKYNDTWLPIENIEMDCVIVVDTDNMKAECKPLNVVKKGEKVVVGRAGVKVEPLESRI